MSHAKWIVETDASCRIKYSEWADYNPSTYLTVSYQQATSSKILYITTCMPELRTTRMCLPIFDTKIYVRPASTNARLTIEPITDKLHSTSIFLGMVMLFSILTEFVSYLLLIWVIMDLSSLRCFAVYTISQRLQYLKLLPEQCKFNEIIITAIF